MTGYYDNLLDDAFERDIEDFTYGVSPQITKRLLARAADGFNWSEWRDKLHDMGEHYKLSVSGIPDQDKIDIHFIHRKSENPKAIPLLMVHGWPGSVLEFHGICKLLSPNYHLVMPSIPGFGWSGAPKKAANTQGGLPWDFTKSAICFNAVMLSLGYEKYVTQGGDWGSMLTRHAAQCFPDNIKAIHVNFFSGATTPEGTGDLTDLEKRGLKRLQDFKRKGMAYSEMQGTTPYTLGGVLSTSPAATIIYIGEKVFRWSSPSTHPSDDEVIANIMIYWFTQTLTSSFWLYYFRRSGDGKQAKLHEDTKIEQPLWFGCGPYEIHWPARRLLEHQVTNIRSWKVLEKGGHFLAWEAPDVLAHDINEAFQTEEVIKIFSDNANKM